jgi:hypothetical protein
MLNMALINRKDYSSDDEYNKAQSEHLRQVASNTFLMEQALFLERDESYINYLKKNENTDKLKTWEIDFLAELKKEEENK